MTLRENFHRIFEKELVEEILKIGKSQSFSEGEIVINIGQIIHFIPIILKGSLKISMIDDDGRELLMYYIDANKTCAMTFSCCMEKRKSKVIAIAEEDTEIWAIPVEYMDKLMLQYPTWKSFVMTNMQERFIETLRTLDMVVFKNLDTRLINYLREKSKLTGKSVINVSHEQIANDLASSRVVISRLLKKLEIEKKVLLFRNQIKLLQDFYEQ